MKSKSLRKQLKSSYVDWEAVVERARSFPREISSARVREALKKTENIVPLSVIEDFLKLSSSNSCPLVDLNTLRYACCYVQHTSAQMMALLLDHHCHTSNSVVQDTLDILTAGGGGHFHYARYSIEALLEVLKRSKRKDILHMICQTYYDNNFALLHRSHMMRVLAFVIDQNPSALSNVDDDGNIPLHHLCRREENVKYVEPIIGQATMHNIFTQNKCGGLLIKNKHQKTPLDFFVRIQSDVVLDMLNNLFTECVLTSEDVVSLELLHVALQHKNEDVARMLISKFPETIKIFSRKEGDLPLHVATQRKIDLELVQLMLCEGINYGLGNGCGGLCVNNRPNSPAELQNSLTPIQNIVKLYRNDEVAEFLEILIGAGIIKEADVVNMGLLPIALREKCEDVIRLIVQQCPLSLHASSDDSEEIPLHIACQNNTNTDLIRLMIATGNSTSLDARGGLMKVNKLGLTPLQHLASNNSDDVNDLLQHFLDSNPPLIEAEDIINFNLNHYAIVGKAVGNFDLFNEYLSDELKKKSFEFVNKEGRSNVHFLLKKRHTNSFILRFINESVRIIGDSGIFVEDNFGDMPFDILLRPHYPRWEESTLLIKDFIDIGIVTKEKVVEHNLLHKVARWPSIDTCRHKAQILLTHFPEALSSYEDDNMPIHSIISNVREWNDIASMLAIFVKFGIQESVGGDMGVGGLLVKNAKGLSTLASCILYERDKFQSSKDTTPLIRMIQFCSSLLKPFPETFYPFVETSMTLMPVNVLSELVTFFDGAATMKDKEGRLLLHIATLNGLKWDNGLDRILAGNKRAILEIDTKTGCYPILLAAANEDHDIDTIFELLQRDLLPLASIVFK
jgi:hypothetical protein